MSKDKSRRDFIVIASYSMGAVGAGAAIWPIIDQMNPAADTLAMSSTEVNIGELEIGQALTVKWRGKPVFIRRRTETEINDSRKVSLESLRDPQADEDRVQKDEWLIVMGVCTHLGCTPNWLPVESKFKCPCHGSGFRMTGIHFEGPAPRPLERFKISLANDGQILVDKTKSFKWEKGEWEIEESFLKI